jgi:hypothetical protein
MKKEKGKKRRQGKRRQRRKRRQEPILNTFIVKTCVATGE